MGSRSASGRIAAVALVATLALIPFLLRNNFQVFILTLIGIYTMLTVGLSLVMGYAGQVSLGHATFYGMGAYATALLSARLGLPGWLALILAALATGILGYVLGIPIFRLRGHYLAMATLGLNVIFVLILKNESDLTGGPSGFTSIPPMKLGSLVLNNDTSMYYLVWAAALGILWLSFNIVRSRVGRALRAIHASELGAETLGVDATAFKLKVFALAAAYAGLAGGLYAQTIRFISPSSFDVLFSIKLVTMSAVGGLANVWGSIFGAATVVLLAEFIRDQMNAVLAGATGEAEIIIFGILLVVIMVFMPEGLVVSAMNSIRRWQGRRRVSASA